THRSSAPAPPDHHPQLFPSPLPPIPRPPQPVPPRQLPPLPLHLRMLPSQLLILLCQGLLPRPLVLLLIVVLDYPPAALVLWRHAPLAQRAARAALGREAELPARVVAVALLLLGRLTRWAGQGLTRLVQLELLRAEPTRRRRPRRRHADPQVQSLCRLQLAQRLAPEAGPVLRELLDVVAVRQLLGPDQGRAVAALVAVARQHVDAGDQLAVGVLQDVHQVAGERLAVLAPAGVGVDPAEQPVGPLGVLAVV